MTGTFLDMLITAACGRGIQPVEETQIGAQDQDPIKMFVEMGWIP